MLEDSWAVAKARRPEAIVAHQKTLAAPHIAEKLGIPHVQALTVPMLTPTREFPLPAMVRRDLGGVLNRASYRLVGLLTRPYSGLIRSWREDHLGLAPRGDPPAPAKTLYCYSPSLVPTPADWPPDTVATGYWLREGRGEEPVDPELEAFVARGRAAGLCRLRKQRRSRSRPPERDSGPSLARGGRTRRDCDGLGWTRRRPAWVATAS